MDINIRNKYQTTTEEVTLQEVKRGNFASNNDH